MMRLSATSAVIFADPDDGEGWVTVRWPHELYGYEELKVDIDGHCSRRMPIYSGSGSPDLLELRRDGLRMRFDPELARKLRLDEEIEILFSLTDAQFEELCRLFEDFGWTAGGGHD